MLGCYKSGLRGLGQFFFVGSLKLCLTVVAKAEVSVGIVDGIVGFVSDENDARAVVDVAVVGNVDEELGPLFIKDDPVSDPAVEDGNDGVKVFSTLKQNFNVEVLKLDLLQIVLLEISGRFFFEYGSHVLSPLRG